MTDDIERTIMAVERFNEKHGLETKNQGLQLGAEVGELQDEILKQDKDGMKEEIGDVLFVAISVALLEDIDFIEAVYEVSMENIAKDGSKKGGKVTKE